MLVSDKLAFDGRRVPPVAFATTNFSLHACINLRPGIAIAMILRHAGEAEAWTAGVFSAGDVPFQ
jgi:hypothetical protein